jgi:Ni2+-binding GTPase involved in maturation of urease and hydrogenase
LASVDPDGPTLCFDALGADAGAHRHSAEADSEGGTCHLDAPTIARALARWALATIGLLFVETVGNLVRPTSFDLGEDMKIVLLSVSIGYAAVSGCFRMPR